MSKKVNHKQWFHAAQHDELNTIQAALKEGFNVDTVNSDKNSAAMLAALHGSLKVLTCLMENHSDLSLRNFKGNGILYNAVLMNQVDIVHWLLKNNPELMEDDEHQNGYSSLMQSLLLKEMTIFNILIDHKGPINRVALDGNSALSLAYELNRHEEAQRLIQKGANINLQNQWNETVLMLMVESNNKESLRLILQQGALLNLKNIEDQTALMLAIKYNNTEMIYDLLEAGSDLKRNEDVKSYCKIHPGLWDTIQCMKESIRLKAMVKKTDVLKKTSRL